MGPTAVVKFATLFEFDSTHLDLKLASDFPRVLGKTSSTTLRPLENRHVALVSTKGWFHQS
jgi:hypothetical protein